MGGFLFAGNSFPLAAIYSALDTSPYTDIENPWPVATLKVRLARNSGSEAPFGLKSSTLHVFGRRLETRPLRNPRVNRQRRHA